MAGGAQTRSLDIGTSHAVGKYPVDLGIGGQNVGHGLLREAERTLDVEARRAIMCDLEQVQMDRGPVGIAFFTNVWYIAAERFKNIRAHPTNYDHLDNVWEDV